MGSNRDRWNKFGRFITGLVMVSFFLPFFAVSCNGTDLVVVSGADMVFGCTPGGALPEMAKEMEKEGLGGGGDAKAEASMKVDREPLAVVVLVISLAAFGVSWVRKRPALIAAAVLGVAGIGALAGLYITVRGNSEKETTGPAMGGGGGDSGGDDGPGGFGPDEKIEISFETRPGFWLASLGFISMTVLAGLALREKPGPDESTG